MAAKVLEVASAQCAAEDFDGEIVAMNHETGMYFCMKDSAAVLWHDLTAGHSVEALAAVAAGNPEFARSIERLADQLVDAGLMSPTQTVSAPTTPPKLTAAMIAGATPPLLDSFGDMKQLLLLDPVHEVDEDQGWPVPRSDDNASHG